MEGDGRTRRQLTPLSSELQAPADWTAPGPIAEEYKPKKVKRPPRTRKEVLLRGLRRLAITLGLLAGGTALVAFLIVQFWDTSVDRTFTFAYYIAGGGLLAVAFLGSTGRRWTGTGIAESARRPSTTRSSTRSSASS